MKGKEVFNEGKNPLIEELRLQLKDSVDKLYHIFSRFGMDYMGWDYANRDANWKKFKRMMDKSNEDILKRFEKQAGL
jgi:hypothetical protein